MASANALLGPLPLDIHAANVAEKWRKFNLAWENYAMATKLNKKAEPVQVATLLTVIAEDARQVYSTNAWPQDHQRIKPVLQRFADYCQPRRNVLFERYKFNRRQQELGEQHEQYKTVLHKLAEGVILKRSHQTKF